MNRAELGEALQRDLLSQYWSASPDSSSHPGGDKPSKWREVEIPMRCMVNSPDASATKAIDDWTVQPKKQKKGIDPDSDISVDDAFKLIEKGSVSILMLAVEMGMSDPDEIYEIYDYHLTDEMKRRLLELLERKGLLKYGRFFSTLRHLRVMGVVEEAGKLGFDIPPREPVYQVFNGDRKAALTQPLSLRGLIEIIDYSCNTDVVASVLCPWASQYGRSDYYVRIKTKQECMAFMLAKCLKHKTTITVNDALKVFYHPEILHKKGAHNVVGHLTGVPQREFIPLSEVLCLEDIQNLRQFGEHLGLEKHQLNNALSGSNQFMAVLKKAIRMDRLTSENLVYALNASGNQGAIQRVHCLQNVPACALPFDEPVYLSPEELGEVVDEPMDTDSCSEILTLANTRNLKLSNNWYWVGLAMGIPCDELEVIELDNQQKPVLCWYGLLESLMNKGCETRHLYDALCFTEDEAAIADFPTKLTGTEKKPLAALVSASTMGRVLINLANECKDSPETVANILGLSEQRQKIIMHEYGNDPRRAIVEFVNYFMKTNSDCSREEFIGKLGSMICNLNGIDSGLNILRAISATTKREFTEQEQRAINLEKLSREIAAGILEIPDDFKCPITLGLIEDPVYLSSDTTKHAYERKDLLQWVRKEHKSPLTRMPVDESHIVDCPETLKRINEWLQETVSVKGQQEGH